MENARGFHNPRSQGHDHNRGGASGGERSGGGKKAMAEPTNHGGHTYDKAKTAAHSARVESMRSAHAGVGQQDHERILHDTHKLHQSHEQHGHGSKHGEAHHHREE